MGLLDHQMLKIVKGVGKTPGDDLSAEADPIVIDLLDSGSGISLDLTGGWEPNIPSLKNGGLWADSGVSDGRTLISGQNTNVVETIRLIVSSATTEVYAAKFAALQRMVQDCRAFLDEFGQIEPVYLAWWADDAPGPQYALIYNIDMDVVFEDSDDAQTTITLSIEREYGWRGIHPGGNPKQWTIESRGGVFNASNCGLLDATDNLITASLENVTEWSSNVVQTLKNYLDIPGDLIPGDLPALVSVVTSMNASGLHGTLSISRSTKPTSLPARNVTVSTEYQYNDLTAAVVPAGSLGTDTSLATDTGGTLYAPASANRRRAEVSFATLATDAQRLGWGNSASRPLIGINSFRGRYMAFLRARQNGGALGNILMSLLYGVNSATLTALTRTTEVSPTLQAGAGDTTSWPITYMGVISLPPDQKAIVNADGKGLYVAPQSDADFSIRLYARRVVAAGVLYVADLLLIPIDEASVIISALANTAESLVYDTTGYFRRGSSEGYAMRTTQIAGTTKTNSIASLAGDDLFLMPKTNNRLYFFGYSATNESHIPAADAFDVYVNIVPRWSGIRDA